MQNKSYFDGDIISYTINYLIGTFVTAISFGILFPWVACYHLKWKTYHTVIEGRRLYFDGTAMGLFGNWIKWLILTILTFGIYGFWVKIKLQQWITKHTHFQN